jgi:hypothetical protein
MPNRAQTAVNPNLGVAPFTKHLRLDETGYASWEPHLDAEIEEIGCINEDPEQAIEVNVRGPYGQGTAAQFSALHLGILWPKLLRMAWSIIVDHRAGLEVRGPKGAIIVLAGRWSNR